MYAEVVEWTGSQYDDTCQLVGPEVARTPSTTLQRQFIYLYDSFKLYTNICMLRDPRF